MLARGALVYGMAGGTAEERRRLIEVARELREAPSRWANAIEETLNQVFIPADANLLRFGKCANDDIDLRCTGKGVARHAELIMDALDHLRAPENAAAAAERGLLVRPGALAGVPAAPVAQVRGAARVPRRVEGGRRVRARRLGRWARVARWARAVCGVWRKHGVWRTRKNKKAKKSLSLSL